MVNSHPWKFNGHCLINSSSSVLRNLINLYISCILDSWSRYLNTDFTLGNCLFGAVKLTKNADPDKYGYTGYGIGFDPRSQFSLPDGNWGKNSLFLELVIVFLCMLIMKRILVLGEDPTQGIDDTTITAESKYSINLTESWKRIALSRHYKMESTDSYLLMLEKYINSMQKIQKKNHINCI